MSLQVVLEGSVVNLDVTSPGATLALGLMFLRTNDAAVAAGFNIPDTHYALDYVRPDFIQMRVLARALVMWDSVMPTDEWLQGQLPDIIKVNVPVIEAAKEHVRQLCKSLMWDEVLARSGYKARCCIANIQLPKDHTAGEQSHSYLSATCRNPIQSQAYRLFERGRH